MRIRKVLPAVLSAVVLLQTTSAGAHHSAIAQFDLRSPLTLSGTLTKLEWVNPHSWIYLNVKGADGQVAEWKVEAGSPLRMEARGLKKEDLKPGVQVIIGGFAAKDGTRTMAGWIVTFPEREGRFPEQESSFPLGR